MSQGRMTRRRFLSAAAQASAVFAVPVFVPGRVLGLDGGVAASERITLAGLGIGGRGGYVLGCMMDEPVVQFVAIADPQKARREAVKVKAEAKYGPGVAMYRDFREMLPREDIDAVLIATGDRWHTLASINVAKSGKDIYCEKPCSMTIAESQALADTMRRYGRIYTAGTQRRSVANFLFAAELCHTGKLGKLTTVHANTLHPAVSHDWLPAEPEPSLDECDWDLWLGPTPVATLQRAVHARRLAGLLRFPWRRDPGVGSPHRRPLQLGRHQRSKDAGALRAHRGGLHCHLRRRSEDGHARRRLDGAGHVQRALRRRRRLGGDRRQRARWSFLRASCDPSRKPTPRPGRRR